MRSMRKLVLALLATVALARPAATQQANLAWADKLFAGVTTHDFGVVARGAQLKHSFHVTNIYKVPLEITQLRVSCGCVTATMSTKVLQPNESTILNVTMDGRQFNGPKSVRIYVTVGPEYISTATLTVTANARQDVVLTPTELDFGNVGRGQPATKFIDVEYVGGLDWQVSEIVKSAASPFDLKVEELPRLTNQPPRRGYRIHATIKADAPAGQFKQEVVLKTNDPSSPVLSFNISGSVQATLTISPSPLAISGLRVGESLTKKLLVRGDRPFKVVGVDGQGEGVTVEIPNREEKTHLLTVQVQPTRAGPLTRTLTIRTDLGNEAATVQVEGEVVP
jgi:hypothetical protein